MNATRILPLLATALVLAACADATDPARPDDTATPDGPAALLAVTCTASRQAKTVSCGAPVQAGTRNVIIGGQHQFVDLTSSNIAVVADSFMFDVTVTNLIPQPIGTTNGTSADAAGVRVFFNSLASTGAGTITVANPDGTGTFTAAGQPYFQYNIMLAQDATSPAKRFKLRFSPEVNTFTFTVYVSAAVQYPNGYIDDHQYVVSLNPSESRTLTGTVRNFAGTPQVATISWSSNAPATASVAGSLLTAGAARGFATLTATSGLTSGLWSTAVSVCQATVVANGASLPSSIANTDCFSSYGDPNGRPTTSYYADLFRVTLTAGQTITVTMDSGDDLDTYLLLAEPAQGFLVAGNDDDDDGDLGVGSKMIYTATASGVYVIEASTFNGLDTGNYTLGVTIS